MGGPRLDIVRPMGGEEPAASRDFPDRRGDLAFILQRERRGSSAPVLEALLELRSGDGQPAVRDASDRLVRQNAPWALDLTALARELIGAAGKSATNGSSCLGRSTPRLSRSST